MAKKRPTYNIPQLLPRKKKEILKIVQNPQAMQRIIALNKAASEVLEKKEKTRALTVDEWLERSFSILPEEYDYEEVKNKIKSCFEKEGVADDSCDERERGEHE